jgi:hypothetical protein
VSCKHTPASELEGWQTRTRRPPPRNQHPGRRACCGVHSSSSSPRAWSASKNAGLTSTSDGPARGPWTNLGRLPLRVFSIGKYAFQKTSTSESVPLTLVTVCVQVCSPGPAQAALRLSLAAARGTTSTSSAPVTVTVVVPVAQAGRIGQLRLGVHTRRGRRGLQCRRPIDSVRGLRKARF